MVIAGISATIALIASAIVNTLAKRREAKIWKEVEVNRQKLNRTQTLKRWKRYSKNFENHQGKELTEAAL